MNRHEENIRIIKELSEKIKDEGLRVFISGNGEYGFFTNKEGSKVVSFGADLTEVRFTGNYKTTNPGNTGTGWRLGENVGSDFNKLIINCTPPRWAIGDASYCFTTLEQHLDSYQKSSKYTEI